jgi:acyl-CoA reductase-like NAD-dependent aldehyde dehydrogenase
MSSKAQLERVLNYVDIAKTRGRVSCSRRRSNGHRHGKGYFMQPTVFGDVTPDDDDRARRNFGPVLAAIDFADVDEAIARANDSIYGLAAGDLDARHQEGALRRVEAAGRHRLGQHLQPVRHIGAVRRLQAERLRRENERYALDYYTQGENRLVDLTQ